VALALPTSALVTGLASYFSLILLLGSLLSTRCRTSRAPTIVVRVLLECGVASVHAKSVEMLPFTEAIVVVDHNFILPLLPSIDLILIDSTSARITRRALS